MIGRKAAALVRAAVGLALLAGVLTLAEPVRVFAVLRGADLRWLLAGFVAAVASNVVSALRWAALARWLGTPLPPRLALRWYFQAIGLSALLPGAVVGGDVYRAWRMRQSGASLRAAGWSVALDRLSGLWMLLALSGLGVVWSAPMLGPRLGLSPGLLVGAALTLTLGLLAAPALLGHRLAGGAGGAAAAGAVASGGWRSRRAVAVEPLRSLAGRPDAGRELRLQALASLTVQLLSAAAFAGGARALGIDLPAAVWALAVAPIFLMATLPVSVGGWGTREAAAALVLAAFGVATAQAVGASLVYGLFALGQALLGALAFGLPERQEAAA